MRSRTSQEKQIVAVLVLITLAIVGYLDGHARSAAAPVETAREASNGVTTVNYASASGWQPASRAPTVPGLSIAQPLVLAPGGDSAHAGLIVGQVPGGEASPVPPQLLANLRQLRDAEVVDLLNTQAYRYSRATVTGSRLTLALFVIPVSATTSTAIACYASAGFDRYLRTCEQLAGTLTIATGRPHVEVRTFESLTPKLGYGRQIGVAVGRVNELLLTLRPQLRRGVSRVTASAVSERLADGFAAAAASLSRVQPPPAARRAQLVLSESLGRAREAYSALGAAVTSEDASEYASALSQVYSAEAGLSAALKNFNLLAYK